MRFIILHLISMIFFVGQVQAASPIFTLQERMATEVIGLEYRSSKTVDQFISKMTKDLASSDVKAVRSRFTGLMDVPKYEITDNGFMISQNDYSVKVDVRDWIHHKFIVNGVVFYYHPTLPMSTQMDMLQEALVHAETGKKTSFFSWVLPDAEASGKSDAAEEAIRILEAAAAEGKAARAAASAAEKAGTTATGSAAANPAKKAGNAVLGWTKNSLNNLTGVVIGVFSGVGLKAGTVWYCTLAYKGDLEKYKLDPIKLQDSQSERSLCAEYMQGKIDFLKQQIANGNIKNPKGDLVADVIKAQVPTGSSFALFTDSCPTKEQKQPQYSAEMKASINPLPPDKTDTARTNPAGAKVIDEKKMPPPEERWLNVEVELTEFDPSKRKVHEVRVFQLSDPRDLKTGKLIASYNIDDKNHVSDIILVNPDKQNVLKIKPDDVIQDPLIRKEQLLHNDLWGFIATPMGNCLMKVDAKDKLKKDKQDLKDVQNNAATGAK
jgi:hypothetical protein